MGPFKLLTLAFATSATASTFYGSSCAPTGEQVNVTVTATVIKGPASEQTPPNVVTFFPNASDTGLMSAISSVTPTSAPAVAECLVPEGCVFPINGTASTTLYPGSSIPASLALPTGNHSTVIVTETYNSTGIYHSATGSATVSASPTKSIMPVSGAGKAKAGVALGLAALVFGVIGA
jgi:hypothetical protein